MLAGVGGVDAALFVVAADEGVMPQTQEHLAILDLLEVPRGVVALTKVDLVDEPGWLDLVREEVRQTLAGTALAGSRIVAVSALTGQGLPELMEALAAVLAEAPARPNLGRPRLPIDRVFHSRRVRHRGHRHFGRWGAEGGRRGGDCAGRPAQPYSRPADAQGTD